MDQIPLRQEPAASTDSPSLRRAFEILVREHHRRLLAYAHALVDDGALAEDLVQDAFVSAYRNLDRFDQSRDFGAWMRGILRKKFLNYLERRKEQPLSPAAIIALEQVHSDWDAAERDGQGDALTALQQCLSGLGDLLRRCVDAFYREGRTVADIARDDGSSEEVVRKRLQRGREALAECVRLRLAAGGATP